MRLRLALPHTLLLIAACSFVVGAAGLSTSSAPAEIALPLKALPQSLRVDNLVQVTDSHIANLVVEGLFGIGDGTSQTAGQYLSARSTWLEPGRHLRIELRKASFSDGTPVTPSDVVASLERCIRTTDTELSVALREIEGYAAFKAGKTPHLGGLSQSAYGAIEIRTASQAPLLIEDLSQAGCHILKPGPGGEIDLLRGAIGTGPYVLESHSSDRITLRKRKNYHGRNRGPERIVFRASSDVGDFTKLRDWAGLIVTESDPGDETPGFNRFEFSELGMYQLVLNNSRAPFNQVKTRQAVLAALDFEKLREELGWTPGRMQEGLFPYGTRGFRLRRKMRDLERARRLLGELGYTDAKPLAFTITLGRSAMTEKEQHVWPKVFHDVPVRVKVELLPQAELVARRNRGDFESLRIIKYPGPASGQRLLSAYLSTSRWNTPRAHQPECDRLIQGILGTPDAEARHQLLTRADRCLMDQVVLIPLASLQPSYALVKKPWALQSSNPYAMKPYRVAEWFSEGLADESGD